MKNLNKEFNDMILKYSPDGTKIQSECEYYDRAIEHNAITLLVHSDGAAEISRYRWIQDVFDVKPPKGSDRMELACILMERINLQPGDLETIIKLAGF